MTDAELLLKHYLKLVKELDGWFPGPQQAEVAAEAKRLKREIIRRMNENPVETE